MSTQQRVAVIGGGAAGLAAAITAAEQGDIVTVFERMDRVGKKILATGNGRCNLYNITEREYFGQPEFAAQVLSLCGAKEQISFWHRHGLRTWVEEDGRGYPVTFQASTVLDILRFQLERLQIEVILNAPVHGLRRTAAGWKIMLSDQLMDALYDRVVVTGGGKAQPKLGSDGSAYALLAEHGHRLIDPKPALTALETATNAIRGLSGQRVKASVQLVRGAKRLADAEGEVLFTDYGISGICVMECARDAKPGDKLMLNLPGALGFNNTSDVENELRRRRNLWRGQPASRILSGLLSPRLGDRIAEAANVPIHSKSAEQLTSDDLSRLALVLFQWPLEIIGKRGFDQAQITAGGIDTKDFSPFTLESKLVPGLHAAGEVLNVDGPCGGYNLMFAFGSGILAGLNGREVLRMNQISGNR